MSDSFVTKIEDTRIRQQRLRFATGTCWAVVLVAIVAITLTVLDRVLAIQDLAGRLIWSGGFGLCCLLILFQWRRTTWGSPISAQQIATQVENHYPQLCDLVTSGLEFSRQSEEDPYAGSSSLRRAIVLRASMETQEVDWQRLTDSQSFRKALLAIVGVVGLLGIVAWTTPSSLSTGVVRLLNPFSTAEWPRETDLIFIEPPTRVAAGEDVVLKLRDGRGDMPEVVTVHFRSRRQGRWHNLEESLAGSVEVLSIRRPNVQDSFEYRATGGDHRTMPWQKLEVVAAPRVLELTLTAQPPPYTGLPSIRLEDQARVLANSELQLAGVFDQPVKSLKLVSENSWDIPVPLAADSKTFQLTTGWTAKQSDRFHLQLTTQSGLTINGDDLLNLEVLPDLPPQVLFQEPDSDLKLAATAEVPFSIAVQDNLAVQNLELVWTSSDEQDSSPETISLWQESEQSDLAEAVRKKEVAYTWQLEPLDLQPGTVLTIHARASDYQPAMGKTLRPLFISVVSITELVESIHLRETRLAQEIEQILNRQRTLRANTAEWQEQSGDAVEQKTSQFHVGLFHQRNIATRLVGNSDAVLEVSQDILAEIAMNRLELPACEKRLQELVEAVELLAAETLPMLDQEFVNLIRNSESSSHKKQMSSLFAQLALHQNTVILALEQALESLSVGEQFGRFERELRQLLEEQDRLSGQVEDMAPQLLQSESDVGFETVQTLAAKQRQVRRLLAGLLRRMTLDIDSIVVESPTLASRVDATIALAREQGIEATMLEAAVHLSDQRLGRALPLQQQSQKQLQDLLNRLTGRDTESAAERIEQMKQVERELQRLRREMNKAKQAAQGSPEKLKELERLQRERLKLAEKTDQVAKKLERLKVPSAAKAAREASKELRKQLEKLSDGEKAEQKLSEAKQRLAEERQRQQVTLARLELARLESLLKGFVGRQEAILEEILRLDALNQGSVKLTAAQRQSVVDLAEVQQMLREEVADQSERFFKLPVYVLVLQSTGMKMQQVEKRLKEIDTGLTTQQFTGEVLELLLGLVDSVRRERKHLADDAKQDSRGGGGDKKKTGNSSQAQAFQIALGQLKLLKSLQLTLQKETRALESRILEGDESEEVVQQARQLAERQQKLLDVAEQLQPETVEPAPEELFPDLEKELEE